MDLGFFILDELEVGDRTIKGIIDYTTTKHFIFYDLEKNTDPDVSMMVIIWRLYYDNIRFSIFRSTYFPNIDISPTMISKKGVKNFRTSVPLPKTHKRNMRTIHRE